MATAIDSPFDHRAVMDWVQLAFQPFAVIAAGISDDDVRQAKEAVNRAGAFGFVIDPTAFQRALQTGSLERQRELLTLFEDTKRRLKVLFPDGWPT